MRSFTSKDVNLPFLCRFLIITLLLASAFFIWKGVVMHRSSYVKAQELQDRQAMYYSLSQDTQWLAPSDSPLTQELVKIRNLTVETNGLYQAGVGKMLTGLYFLFVAILVTVLSSADSLACKGLLERK